MKELKTGVGEKMQTIYFTDHLLFLAFNFWLQAEDKQIIEVEQQLIGW